MLCNIFPQLIELHLFCQTTLLQPIETDSSSDSLGQWNLTSVGVVEIKKTFCCNRSRRNNLLFGVTWQKFACEMRCILEKMSDLTFFCILYRLMVEIALWYGKSRLINLNIGAFYFPFPFCSGQSNVKTSGLNQTSQHF